MSLIAKFKNINKLRVAMCFVIFIFLSLSSVVKGLFFDNISAAPGLKETLQDTIYLKTSNDCRITIKTFPDVAPKHVTRIKELIKNGFYDGLDFHRVIPGFVAQAGGKGKNVNYGSGKKIKAEFSNKKHLKGVVSMARSSDPDSADSQFFIMLEDAPFLDGKYSIWGIVTEGLDCVERIKVGDAKYNGSVSNPTYIKSMKIALDVEVQSIKSKKK